MQEDLDDITSSEERECAQRYWEAKQGNRPVYLESSEWVSVVRVSLAQLGLWEALSVVEEALDQHKLDTELLLEKAEIISDMGRREEALDILDQIEGLDPLMEEAKEFRAHLLVEDGHYKEAEILLKECEELSGEKGSVGYSMACCLAPQGRIEEAFTYMKHYLRYNSQYVESCNEFVEWVKDWKKVEEAIDFVQKLVKTEAYNKLLWKILCELYEENNQPEMGYETNELVLAIDPEDDEAHAQRVVYASFSNFEEVDYSFKKLKEEKWGEEQLGFFLLQMSKYYYDRQCFEQALECHKRLLQIEAMEEDPNVHYRIGALESALYHYEEAISHYQRAIEKYRKQDEREMLSLAYQEMGRCQTYLGREESGLESYLQAWEANPGRTAPLFDYVMGSCLMGQVENVVVLVDGLIAFDNKQAEYILLKGAVLYYSLKGQQALEYFVRALELDPKLKWTMKESMRDILSDPEVSCVVSDYFEAS